MGANPFTQMRSRPYRSLSRRFGSPHRNYRHKRYSKLIKRIKTALKEGKPATEIIRKFNMPRSTVYSWLGKMNADSEWSPLTTRLGQHRRIFTIAEEESIARRTREEFLARHVIFSDEDCRQLILEEYSKKVQKDPKSARPFSCSAGYVRNFKKRHGFSSRRAHLKRRCVVDPRDGRDWTSYVQALLRSKDNHTILNCDETFWRVFPGPLLTWADTNSENVTIDINGSEKQGLTVLATIAADNTKLPLFFIATGKTETVERTQINPQPGDWTAHTENGWQTSQSFQKYLMHLRELYGDDPLDLILDLHSSHRTNDVKILAASLDITLHYIPAGMTDELQPLDRRVFGALKSAARKLFRERRLMKRTLRDACDDLRKAWQRLGTDTLEEAWDCY